MDIIKELILKMLNHEKKLNKIKLGLLHKAASEFSLIDAFLQIDKANKGFITLSNVRILLEPIS